MSPRTGEMHIHMNGSEWFADRPGGLNRYFQDLFGALSLEAKVTASAFGAPPPGGSTWGDPGSNLIRRVTRSKVTPPSGATVVDSHFALYGRPKPSSGCVAVRHFHGPWSAESEASGQPKRTIRVKHALERRLYAHTDAFIVLSEAFRDVLINEYDVKQSKIAVIPPGVDLTKFQLKSAPPTRPNAIAVRRLERRMGLDVLIRSWVDVLKTYPDAHLDIVGNGTAADELAELVAHLNLGRSIHLRGRVEDTELRSLYEAASISVIPSIALEGFGLIALESLASGTPPIVTDCGGLPDTVTGLDSSLIVPRGDVAALASRICAAFAGQMPSPPEARAHAESFSWAAAAQRHLDLYEGLLA